MLVESTTRRIVLSVVFLICENTPSRLLISEAMILMGNVVARFCTANNIPIAYRGQYETQVNTESSGVNSSNSALKQSLLKTRLKRAYYSTKPSKHFSLGLDGYTHVTSPLRRYSDIITHRQVISFIEGYKLLNSSIISEYIQVFELKSKEIAIIERLIDYLVIVDAPHRRTSDKMTLWRDFKTFYGQYDERRDKSISVFPEILTDWVDTLPDTETKPITVMPSGDSTEQYADDPDLKKIAEEEGWVLKPDNKNIDEALGDYDK